MDLKSKLTDACKIPENWVCLRLGDIITSKKGKKPKNLGSKELCFNIPYINIKAFEYGVFKKYTDGNGCELCNEKDILIVWDGARCGLVGRGVSGAIGSTLTKLMHFGLNSVYLYYFLQTKYNEINKRPKGVGIPHVDPNIFWNINFPLPPLSEQHRIVAKIGELFTKLDAGIEALKKIKAQIKRYRQAVLKYAFEGKLTANWRQQMTNDESGILSEKDDLSKFKIDNTDLPDLPRGLLWIKFENILEKVEKVNPKSEPNKQFIYLDIASINNSLKKVTSPKKYFGVKAPSRARQLVKSGDILFSTVRTYLKNIAFVDEKYNNRIASTGFCVIRPKERINKKYIFYLVQSDSFLNPLNEKQRGTSYPAVRNSDVFSQIIPISQKNEQDKIVEEIERRFSVADEIEKVVDYSLKQSDRLKKSILKKAFEGKLVPQNSTDPPASELLRRIKAEKAKLETKLRNKRKRKNRMKKQRRLFKNG